VRVSPCRIQDKVFSMKQLLIRGQISSQIKAQMNGQRFLLIVGLLVPSHPTN
jgi:hypothetical protein